MDAVHYRNYKRLLSKHGRWTPRRPPSGEYNCAGHVWASRRTCIYEESEYRKILDDDGYRRVTEPMPDDLAIYVDEAAGILHIGRIVELTPGIAEGSPRIPLVVSKWSDWTGEVCHLVTDHNFDNAQGFDVSVEYWTDRP